MKHWNLISRDAVLTEDVVGHGGEIFRAGTRMFIGSEPMSVLAGDEFNLEALDAPAFLPGGPWRGAPGVKRTQFSVDFSVAPRIRVDREALSEYGHLENVLPWPPEAVEQK